jgi:hypothetical protein
VDGRRLGCGWRTASWGWQIRTQDHARDWTAARGERNGKTLATHSLGPGWAWRDTVRDVQLGISEYRPSCSCRVREDGDRQGRDGRQLQDPGAVSWRGERNPGVDSLLSTSLRGETAGAWVSGDSGQHLSRSGLGSTASPLFQPSPAAQPPRQKTKRKKKKPEIRAGRVPRGRVHPAVLHPKILPLQVESRLASMTGPTGARTR